VLCLGSGFLDDLFVLDTELMTWKGGKAVLAGSSARPKGRAYHTLTADPKTSSLYLLGGNNEEESLPDLHVPALPACRLFVCRTDWLIGCLRVGCLLNVLRTVTCAGAQHRERQLVVSQCLW
jgi:hypothetical protein